ncbi:MAG: hypothetical protein K2N91_05620, partial [Muribaculaceae bacterium]|nr:hypothetical protein [Muribaculaceae bacterium]
MNRSIMFRNVALLLVMSLGSAAYVQSANSDKIDRYSLVSRNNPHIEAIDTLASLSVGNGEFAFTVDVTGLQSFPEMYSKGVPLGTQSQWGWHSFGNPENYRFEETLKDYDFGRGRLEPYSVQFNEDGRNKSAANWYRVNPHRLHLGAVGFADLDASKVADIDQTLDLWNGKIVSNFSYDGEPVKVVTTVHPSRDMVAASISSKKHLPVNIRMPYPTGGHCDDACNWNRDDDHITEIVKQEGNTAIIRHTLDSTAYYVQLTWTGADAPIMSGRNVVKITPTTDDWTFAATFASDVPADENPTFAQSEDASAKYWQDFWSNGAAVDFGHCTDPRAKELERRVILSQYLLAIQSAGSTPPQETGLTYNSWFGKFHMEMIWWHQSWLPLYGHADLLNRTLPWYESS